MRKLYTFPIFLIGIFPLFAQVDLTIQDNALFYISGGDGDLNYSNSATNVVHIQGNLINETIINGSTLEGLHNNGGEIQITGNWNNSTINAIYESTGDEVFIGSNTQRITGDFSSIQSDFFHLIVEKSNTSWIELNSDVTTNTLQFNDGRIRTDTLSHGENGQNYAFEFYIRNDNTNAIVGHNTTGNTKYVEGKLKRQVNGGNNYYFPVGVEPSYWDGIEPFEIDFTTASNSNIVGYVQPISTNFINENVYCNINGDNYPDLIEIACQIPLEWRLESSGGIYLYDIYLYPGNNLNNCPWDNTYGVDLHFVAKDGLIGNVPKTPAPYTFQHAGPGYETCPTNFNLFDLQKFSRFAISGATNSALLPVELVDIVATSIDNQYIQVSWITASEVNNNGFVIERSIDGIHFDSIGWLVGNGTTNETNNYSFNDRKLDFNIPYYYRLKQIDFDQTSNYSNIVSALISSSNLELNIGEFFPNPAVQNTSIQIQSSEFYDFTYQFYDVQGRILLEDEFSTNKSSTQLNLDISQFPIGSYFIMLTNGTSTFYRKLITIQ